MDKATLEKELRAAGCLPVTHVVPEAEKAVPMWRCTTEQLLEIIEHAEFVAWHNGWDEAKALYQQQP